jgi:hypothetical protein
VACFFRFHRGHTFASSALMDPISQNFVAALEGFARREKIPSADLVRLRMCSVDVVWSWAREVSARIERGRWKHEGEKLVLSIIEPMKNKYEDLGGPGLRPVTPVVDESRPLGKSRCGGPSTGAASELCPSS